MNLEEGKLYWLIKATSDAIEAVGFMRERWIGWVIGSPTGSYGTGHRENWKSKLEELLSEGYMGESHAKEKKIIAPDWQPPKLKRVDRKLVESIIKRVEG